MAEPLVGLALEGVPIATEHYEKVYDPLKNKTKQGVTKLKKYKSRQGSLDESDFSGYEYDGPPRRPQANRPSANGGRRRPDVERADHLQERHVTRKTHDVRTRSIGPDYQRKGRHRRRDDSRRRYLESDSSISPRPRAQSKRRQSLGERAMAALGLGAGAGAGAVSNGALVRTRTRTSYSTSRSSSCSSAARRRRSGRPVPRNQSAGPAARRRGYYDDGRTPARYRPNSGYTQQNDRRDSGALGNRQLVRRGDRDRRNGRRSSSSSSSSSSSHSHSNSRSRTRSYTRSHCSDSEDVCSSGEDERRTRKMRGKEFLTAGLAAVATIHAAHGVYASMEARDKRQKEVAKGEMTPEEARKLKNKARIQDAAAIGIAALGIKGAYSEWKEVQESRHEMGNLKKERAEHHEKRVRRAERLAASGKSSSTQESARNGRRRRDSR